MFDRFKTVIQRWSQIAEIESLAERDLADLGMSRDQLISLVRLPQDLPDRVEAMGAQHGLTPLALQRDAPTWVELLSTCGHCAQRGRCAKALAQGGAEARAAREFCPNAAEFRALAQRTMTEPALPRAA